jgi:hypothetical protein
VLRIRGSVVSLDTVDVNFCVVSANKPTFSTTSQPDIVGIRKRRVANVVAQRDEMAACVFDNVKLVVCEASGHGGHDRLPADISPLVKTEMVPMLTVVYDLQRLTTVRGRPKAQPTRLKFRLPDFLSVALLRFCPRFSGKS